MPARCKIGFYCRSYCLLNMFRASLCPSSGAQGYYTVVAACGISCCGFQVAGLVWSWGLCVRFAGCCCTAATVHKYFFFSNATTCPLRLRGLPPPPKLWLKCNQLLRLGHPVGAVTLSRWEWWWNERWIWGARGVLTPAPYQTRNLKTTARNTRQQPLHNTHELQMMGIVVSETCLASNKICNKNLCYI